MQYLLSEKRILLNIEDDISSILSLGIGLVIGSSLNCFTPPFLGAGTFNQDGKKSG